MSRRLTRPADVGEIDLLGAGMEELTGIASAFGLSLKEAEVVKGYFVGLGRNPTDVELHAISQLWSEHCRHKTFRGIVMDEDGKGIVDDILSSYIARATEKIGAPWVVSFLEDDAGVVRFVDGYGVAVKVETHNHPSAIDPFGGAATGIGGVIRDVLAVWADPIALVDVLCFGPPDIHQEIGEFLHPRRIARGVVDGIGYYGNNVGIPTVAGAVCFDEGYVGNVVVYAGCLGLLPLDRYARNPRSGDALVLIGNRTGRDGMGGASFASSSLSGKVEELRPAVQIPDPIEEEKLLRFVSKVRDEGLASAITDLGGGGLAVAAAEIAGRASSGCFLDLDAVHVREEMKPWEILVSESQERMLLAAPSGNLDRVMDLAEEEELEASRIGSLTGTGIFEASHEEATVMGISVEFLLHPPKSVKVARRRRVREFDLGMPEPTSVEGALLELLSSPNVSSRESLIRTYDFEVRGNTAVKPLEEPFGGPNDAAVIKPLDERREGIVISVGLKPRYSRISPYWMAASSIEESLRNNVAVGGRRMAILDNFVWGSPEDPDNMWSLVEAARACHDLAMAFGTPFISGKDSLYNESPLGPVLPTLLITAVGLIPDVEKSVTVSLKNKGDSIYVLGTTRKELGGSEYYALRGAGWGHVPKVKPDESKAVMDCLTAAIDDGIVMAAHDVSDGGLGVALAEMVLSSGLGMEVSLRSVPGDLVKRDDYLLFSESNGRFIVEVEMGSEGRFEEIADEKGCTYARMGRVRGDRLQVEGYDGRTIIDLGHEELRDAWRREQW